MLKKTHTLVGCVRRPDSDGQLWKLSKALLLLKDLH